MEGVFNDSLYFFNFNFVYIIFKMNFLLYNGYCIVNIIIGNGYFGCEEDYCYKRCIVYYLYVFVVKFRIYI